MDINYQPSKYTSATNVVIKSAAFIICLFMSCNIFAEIKGEAVDKAAGSISPGNLGKISIEVPYLVFKMRYNLSTFWGEPLEVYHPYYEILHEISLKTYDTTIRFVRVEDKKAEIIGLPNPGGISRSGLVNVPASIFDKIAMTSYRATLGLHERPETWITQFDMEIRINNEGLLGRNGEWGWGFSGISSWQDLAWNQFESITKETWQRFVNNTRRGSPPQAYLQLKSYYLDLTDFRYALTEMLPDVFKPLYNNNIDHQADRLMDDMIMHMRNSKNDFSDSDLQRRKEITNTFFNKFSGKINRAQKDKWEAVLKGFSSNSDISRKIANLKRAIEMSTVGDPEQRILKNLLNSAEVSNGLLTKQQQADLADVINRIKFQGNGETASSNGNSSNSSSAELSEYYVVALDINITPGGNSDTFYMSDVLRATLQKSTGYKSFFPWGYLNKQQEYQLTSWQNRLAKEYGRGFQLKYFESFEEADEYRLHILTDRKKLINRVPGSPDYQHFEIDTPPDL